MIQNLVDIDFFERRNKFRNYLHFDKKKSNKKIFEYVLNEEEISKHSFFPTISYSLKEEKISKKDKKIIRIYVNNKQSKDKFVIDRDSYKKKLRSINFPSHIDGNIYAYYSKILEAHYSIFLENNQLESNIIAFRKITKKENSGKEISLCNIHFAKNVFDFIKVWLIYNVVLVSTVQQSHSTVQQSHSVIHIFIHFL